MLLTFDARSIILEPDRGKNPHYVRDPDFYEIQENKEMIASTIENLLFFNQHRYMINFKVSYKAFSKCILVLLTFQMAFLCVLVDFCETACEFTCDDKRGRRLNFPPIR